MKRVFAIIASLTFVVSTFAQIVWPTPMRDFIEGKSPEDFLQPTAAGTPMSGAFGDVRSNGYRFHEGIDIKPVKRNRKGEPLDDIRAAMDGKIACVNKIAGNSGYGRYIVITHDNADIEVYTLYAHLAEIDPNISTGKRVSAGTRLGQMGRSASYSIARAQAHLHFEIGLRLSNSFHRWYAAKRYKEKNLFGNYNGMNLVGMDPLAFYEAAKNGKVNNGFAGYIKSLPVAFIVRVYTKQIPDFVNIYPDLVDHNGQNCGWDIYMTWYGMPIKFERIKNPEKNAKDGDIEIVKYNPDSLSHKCRRMITQSKGKLMISESLKEELKKIFL